MQNFSSFTSYNHWRMSKFEENMLESLHSFTVLFDSPKEIKFGAGHIYTMNATTCVRIFFLGAFFLSFIQLFEYYLHRYCVACFRLLASFCVHLLLLLISAVLAVYVCGVVVVCVC
eukprot:scpid109598/ scgid8646/ 